MAGIQQGESTPVSAFVAVGHYGEVGQAEGEKKGVSGWILINKRGKLSIVVL